MKNRHRASGKLAERALVVLEAVATEDGYVSCTNRVMGDRLAISDAHASRVMQTLVATGAVEVIRPGTRNGGTTYRLVRASDPDLLREIPAVPSAV